jgi:hypothetical protein
VTKLNHGYGQFRAGKLYSTNTPLTTSNFKIRANPAFQKTLINTVDVYVFYFQSTFNFPSWQEELREHAEVNSR